MAYKRRPQPEEERTEVSPKMGAVTRKFDQWLALKRESDLVAARLKELRDDIMEEIPAGTLGADESGSYWTDLDTPIEGGDGAVYSRLKRERHVKTTLKPVDEVREILEGLEQVSRVRLMNGGGDERDGRRVVLTYAIERRTEEYIDQDYLYQLLAEEVITEQELDSLFDRRVDWYFKPQKDS